MTNPLNATHSHDRTTAVARVVPAHLRRADTPVLTDAYVTKTEQYDGIPAAPPLEVLAEIGAQFDRLEALRADGLSLRFDAQAGSPLRIDVVGDDGEVRRRVGASEAMGIATGERPALPQDRPASPGEHFTFDREA